MNQTRRKTRIGQVVSDKADKTVVVAVEWRQRHPLYRKSIKRISKFHAHDELNLCRLGDQVRIVETRPLSKMKRWGVAEILSRRDLPEIKPSEIAVPLEEAVPAAATAVAVEAPPTEAQVTEAILEPEASTATDQVAEVAEKAEAPQATPTTDEVTEATEEAAAPSTKPVEEPEAPPATDEVAEVTEEAEAPQATDEVAEVASEAATLPAETVEEPGAETEEEEPQR